MSEDELAELLDLAISETEKSTSRKKSSTSRSTSRKVKSSLSDQKTTVKEVSSTSRRKTSTSRSTSRTNIEKTISEEISKRLSEVKQEIINHLLVESTSRLEKLIKEKFEEMEKRFFSTSRSTSRLSESEIRRIVRDELEKLSTGNSSTSRSTSRWDIREEVKKAILELIETNPELFLKAQYRIRRKTKPIISNKRIKELIPHLIFYSTQTKKRKKEWGPRKFTPVEFWSFLKLRGINIDHDIVRAFLVKLKKDGVLKKVGSRYFLVKDPEEVKAMYELL